MLKNNFPFYKNQMSNWNFFLKKNKKKISLTPGLVNWHLIKEFGVNNITKYLVNSFSKKVIRKSTLLDIGCNDGYLTERLARLKFKKIIGAEPRQEVILKGRKIRNFYGIETLARYKNLSINKLSKLKQSYDIIICSGVLHHTDNFFLNLKKILLITKNKLILEGEFIPDGLLQSTIFKQAQLKDLIYSRKENKDLYGITLEKFETPYNCGSTIKFGFVQIVSISSIKIYAQILGYDALIYKKKIFNGDTKAFRAIIIFSKSKNIKKDINFENELFFLKTLLPNYLIKNLANTDINKKFAEFNNKKFVKFKRILENIKIAPYDKILFEKAKYLIFRKNNKKMAYLLLLQILNRRDKLNNENVNKLGDWFSQYRALYFLYLMDIKNIKKRKYWKNLLLNSNFYFPKKLFNFKIVKKHFSQILL
jgi:SAM-dependent methyltransferase